MKKILIYGDSNTWGDNFITGVRIPDEKQWPNILQIDLGNKYKIIQEGLPGRIAGNDEQEKIFKNGKDTFLSTFRTSAPVDIIIISLGTNDLQIKYKKSVKNIIDDLLWYRNAIEQEYDDLENRKKYFFADKMPIIIYILPPNFDYQINAKNIFNQKSEDKRQKIIDTFLKNKCCNKCLFYNNLTLFSDGIHLDFNGHKIVADDVRKVILEHE